MRNAIKLCLYWYKRYMSLHSKTVTRPSKKYRQHTQKMLPYEMCSSIKIPPYFKLNKAKCITTYQIYIWDSWSRSRGWYGLCPDKEERRKDDWSWGKKNRTEKGHPQLFPTSWVSWGRGWPSFWAPVLGSCLSWDQICILFSLPSYRIYKCKTLMIVCILKLSSIANNYGVINKGYSSHFAVPNASSRGYYLIHPKPLWWRCYYYLHL